MQRTELRRYARMGAQARLLELQREMAAIVTAFPGLRDGRKGARAVVASNGVEPRRRRRMSTAARKAIAAAQRKRWAAWRKQRGR